MMSGLSAPKRVTCLCSDGIRRRLILKVRVWCLGCQVGASCKARIEFDCLGFIVNPFREAKMICGKTL